MLSEHFFRYWRGAFSDVSLKRAGTYVRIEKNYAQYENYMPGDMSHKYRRFHRYGKLQKRVYSVHGGQ